MIAMRVGSQRPLNPRDRVILGGHDLEMREIAHMLHASGLGACIVDRKLRWGARMSMARRAIMETLKGGGRVVCVELTDDLPRSLPRQRLMIVDHHGARAGANKPSALRQIHQLIGGHRRFPWSRRQRLVEVNDVAHIAGLRTMGATALEIRQTRDADRRAQGVTAETERLSRKAIGERQARGWLTMIETTASTGSAITDLMDPAYGGPGANDLLVFTAGSAGFYGRGDVVLALARRYPGSWSGGALPLRGYWGAPRNAVPSVQPLANMILLLV